MTDRKKVLNIKKRIKKNKYVQTVDRISKTKNRIYPYRIYPKL